MKHWFGPSLTRRTIVAFLVVYVASWLTILWVNYFILLEEQSQENQIWLQEESKFLDQFSEASSAVNFMRKEAANVYRHTHPEALMALSAKNGHLLFSSHTVFPFSSAAGTKILVNGKHFHAYRYEGQRWILQVAFPVPTLNQFVQIDGPSLGRQTLIGVLLLLPAVLLAIRKGLSPLQALSKQLKEREVDAISPIHFDAKYKELKRLLASINRLLRRLRHKIALEQAFVENAAHELRTPLAVISAQTHVLAHALNDVTKEEAQHHLMLAMDRAKHLIGQLLELARVDGAGQQQNLLLDVAQLTRLVSEPMTLAAKARQMTLVIHSPPCLMHRLEKESYASILLNLIDNAIRYGHTGGHITVDLTTHDRKLILTVSDNGPGIATVERELVFERFYRGNGHDTPGSGLGLSIVKQAVKRLGANIILSDGLHGTGCRFMVSIPMQYPVKTRK